MVQLTDNIYAVEVQDDATNFGWRAGQFTCKLPDCPPGTYHWIVDADDFMWSKGGTWHYLFTTKGCTEEDARKAVNVQGSGYEDYHDVTPDYFLLPFAKATDSLESLLKAKGCDPNKNWAIIQKL